MFQKYQRLRASGLFVFDRRTIANLLDLAYASTNPVLHRLLQKGILLRLKRDCYVLADALPEKSRKVANELVKPSCLSLWTALSDAGLTTQVPRVIQSVTPKRSQVIESPFGMTFTYDHLPERLFSGFHVEEDLFRATPEKALLDLLLVQGGKVDWESIAAARFDRALLTEMSLRFPRRVRQALQHSPLRIP